MTETYYTVLGVPRSSSPPQIKIQYYELIKQFHPDAIPNGSPALRKMAEQKAQDLNEAYQVLSNPDKRRLYDQQLDSYQQSQPSQGTTRTASSASQTTNTQGAATSSTTSRHSQSRTRARRPSNPNPNTASTSGSQPRSTQSQQTQSTLQPIAPAVAVLGTICFLWGAASTVYLFAAPTGDVLSAFLNAYGAFLLTGWMCSSRIRQFMLRLGVTGVLTQVVWFSGALLFVLVQIAARSEERRG